MGTSSSAPLNQERTGLWLPKNQQLLRNWVDGLMQRTVPQTVQPLDPVLQDFKKFIDNEPTVRMYATTMFEQVPLTPPYNKDPTKSQRQVRDYDHMLELMNQVVHEGPQVIGDPASNGCIGFPITAIVEWPMATPSGFVFFTMASVNKHIKAVLNKWKEFLISPASQIVLNPENGWTSPHIIKAMTEIGNNNADDYTFEQLYKCPDPSKPNLGFDSWDAFFLREFHDGVRPVATFESVAPTLHGIEDSNQIIVHACESTPYRLEKGVSLRDAFWVKGQPYSLVDMFRDANIAAPFANGTVYQAYLSALSYHRWHAPVSGMVTSITYIPGTYYSENFYQGFSNPEGPDPVGPNNSQAYIAEVATRAIITIEADNPSVGLMAGVFIGLCEASSCEFWVKSKQYISKGQQIGAFHYGGSSHCLVFRPETQLTFADPGPYDGKHSNKKVNSLLALAS